MTGKGLEQRGEEDRKGGGRKEPCGEEDTQQGPDYYSFFCCTAGKIKICGEERLVLQEQFRLFQFGVFFVVINYICLSFMQIHA